MLHIGDDHPAPGISRKRAEGHPERSQRLAGKGLPRVGGGAGDLYAVLNIVVPATLTERERQLFEELREASRFEPRSRFKP